MAGCVTKTPTATPKGFWFVPVDRKVALDKTLSPRELQIYVVLCVQANGKRSVSLPVRKICDLANCKERTAQNALRTLAERGLISREVHFKNGLQLATTYRLIGCEAESYAEDAPGVQIFTDEGAEVFTPPAESCTGDCQNSAPRVLEKESFRKNQENPTPLNPQSGEKVLGVEKSSKGENQEHDAPEQEQKPSTAIYEAILTLFHRILPELPPVVNLQPEHIREIEARIREDPTRREVTWWERYFRSIRDYPCAMGKGSSGWKAYFGWLVSEKGMRKVLSGAFIRDSGTKGGSESGWALQKQFTNEEGVVDARALLRQI